MMVKDNVSAGRRRLLVRPSKAVTYLLDCVLSQKAKRGVHVKGVEPRKGLGGSAVRSPGAVGK